MRSSFLGSDRRADTKNLETQFNIYWCESQKKLVLIQCIIYGLFFTCLEAAALAQYLREIGFTESFWIEMGLACPANYFNCTDVIRNETSDEYVADLVAQATVTVLGSVIQLALFVVGAIIVRKRAYQRRWTLFSTVLIAVCAVAGPVAINIWDIARLLQVNVGLILNSTGTSAIRLVMLETLSVGLTERFAGLTGLQLLMFAPRFVPFCAVSCTLAVAETVAEVATVVILLEGIGEAPLWDMYMSTFNIAIPVRILYCNIVGYAVPAGLIWCFERMLWSKYCLGALCFVDVLR